MHMQRVDICTVRDKRAQCVQMAPASGVVKGCKPSDNGRMRERTD